jgi:hypothetical protein
MKILLRDGRWMKSIGQTGKKVTSVKPGDIITSLVRLPGEKLLKKRRLMIEVAKVEDNEIYTVLAN